MEQRLVHGEAHGGFQLVKELRDLVVWAQPRMALLRQAKVSVELRPTIESLQLPWQRFELRGTQQEEPVSCQGPSN